MARYQKEDKVKIREDLILGEFYGDIGFANDMDQFIGKYVTIDRPAQVDSPEVYFIKEDNNWYIWSVEMFENITKTTFTKSNLEFGMVVEFNNRIRGIVFKNAIFMINKYIDLDEFDEFLNHNQKKPYTIKKVYNSIAGSIASYLYDANLELIWEREE